MRIGSLFSGIGGLELGLERAGLGQVVFQVENNPHCKAVLARHWPNVLRFEDVREVDPAVLPPIELLCGGFPCQGNSAAGKGLGLKDPRSALWYEFRRIVEAIRPAWVVVENVASGARRWLPHVRRDLHVLGYQTDAIALSAADVGAPHVRRRVFVVADTERLQLRDEHGRRGGSRREGSTVARDDGQEGALAHADGDERRSLRANETGHPGSRSLPERGAVLARGSEGATGDGGTGGWWLSEPNVGRVVDGVSSRVDGSQRRNRLKALGNAVVPQCAEAVGRMILERQATPNAGVAPKPTWHECQCLQVGGVHSDWCSASPTPSGEPK